MEDLDSLIQAVARKAHEDETERLTQSAFRDSIIRQHLAVHDPKARSYSIVAQLIEVEYG